MRALANPCRDKQQDLHHSRSARQSVAFGPAEVEQAEMNHTDPRKRVLRYSRMRAATGSWDEGGKREGISHARGARGEPKPYVVTWI